MGRGIRGWGAPWAVLLAGAMLLPGVAVAQDGEETPVTPGLETPCQDVFLLFTRGSGQPPEKVDGDGSPREYLTLKEELGDALPDDVAFSSLDLANDPDVGTELGYPAFGEIDDFAEGELHWAGVFGGRYRESQASGVGEAGAWLDARMDRCPDEAIVAAGYSQGAHVMGETLLGLDAAQQDQLGYGVLFGDPKLDDGRHAFWPWSWHEAPWLRGTHTNDVVNDAGSLEPRHPYRPDGIDGKFTSWCDAADGVCVDNPALMAAWFAGLNSSHSEYRADEIPAAVNEMLPTLMARLDRPDGDGFEFNFINLRDGNTQMVDLLVVFDTTGSMGTHINSAKAQATDLATVALAAFPSTRISLVEYRDHGDPSVANLVVPFTSDRSSFVDGVNTLRASGGGDYPEALLSGLMTGFDQDWRNGALKMAIVITDAPMKDPEPVTGFTATQVLREAYELDPVQIYPVIAGSNSTALATARTLAEGSDGEVISLGSSSLADRLTELIEQLRHEPVATLAAPPTVRPGDAVTLNAGGSFDPDGAIVGWEWDLDGDGTFEQPGTRPTQTTTFDATGPHTVGVRVLAFDGGSSTATAVVTVDEDFQPETIEPPSDVRVEATGADGQASVSWQPSPSAVDGYVIRRYDDGTLLGVTTDPSQLAATIVGVPDGEAVQVQVEAYRAGLLSVPAISNVLTQASVLLDAWGDTLAEPPNSNGANAGRTVPVSFRLLDAQGQPVSDPAAVATLGSAVTDCQGTPTDDADEADDAGQSGLRHQHDGWWKYNWQTQRAWGGTCRMLTLELAGGSTHHLRFDFR